MNTTTRMMHLVASCALVVSGILYSAQGVAAPSEEEVAVNWDQVQLHNPSETLLAAESRGRVTIYDGLYQSDVDRAMDEQFRRIDRMMFIRTQQRTEVGHAMDEECD